MTRGDDWRDLIGKVNCMDAFDLLRMIPDGAVDLVLTDMPYGITACAWDKVPNLAALWIEFKRISKKNAAFVFTASQPFTTDLINSNRKWFKYEWIWVRGQGSNFALMKYQPMKDHNNVLVFGNKMTYNPIMQDRSGSGLNRNKYGRRGRAGGDAIGAFKTDQEYHYNDELRFPSSVQYFTNKNQLETAYHPTQKPVELMSYIIQTYSNPGDLILDPFMGSWTTAVAAKKLGRRFIGSELSPEYCKIGEDRLRQEVLDLFTNRKEGIRDAT